MPSDSGPSADPIELICPATRVWHGRQLRLMPGDWRSVFPRLRPGLESCLLFGQAETRSTAQPASTPHKPRGTAPKGGLTKLAIPELYQSLDYMVRAVGIEPTRAKPNGFSYQLRLSPPPATLNRAGAFVVWTIPSPCFGEPKSRCCPSSLYTFPGAFAPGLGSGSPSDRVPRI